MEQAPTFLSLVIICQENITVNVSLARGNINITQKASQTIEAHKRVGGGGKSPKECDNGIWGLLGCEEGRWGSLWILLISNSLNVFH